MEDLLWTWFYLLHSCWRSDEYRKELPLLLFPLREFATYYKFPARRKVTPTHTPTPSPHVTPFTSPAHTPAATPSSTPQLTSIISLPSTNSTTTTPVLTSPTPSTAPLSSTPAPAEASDHTQTISPSLSQRFPPNISAVLTADVGGDGKKELLVGMYDHTLYSFTFETKETEQLSPRTQQRM